MPRKCEKCDCEIPEDAPGLDCPACQLRSAFSAGDDLEGRTIGNYKLISKIGVGGFGVVYLAQQTEPVRRQVAFKIMKRSRIGTAAATQFVAEQQALAVMNHPNIAKIFDAGETDWGAPYFVMELIEGVPITKYCDKRRLTPNQRVSVFREVCGAIHHAHQKAIIHRDIKPSNILVVEIDDQPVPKIIDFGIAKAIGTPLHELFFDYHHYSVIGTPEYMPPEQARGDSDIDTRADIYSLGILLYELLIGTPPFSRREIRNAGIDAILKLIEEKRPPSPSERLNSMEDHGETIAQSRHLEPPELKKIIRGDLDWIVMKAIEKNRKSRYESASAMAKDIDAFLKDRPLTTRRRTIRYRTSKFCRRNRILVSAIAALVVVAAIGAAITFSMWKRQRHVQADTLFDKLLECRVEHLPMVVAEIGAYSSILDDRLATASEDPSRSERARVRTRLALLPRQPKQVMELHESLLTADPVDLAIYFGILDGHESDLETLAWRWAPDESADTSKRLRAAAIGAFANPQNPRWNELSTEISDWLIANGPFATSPWLRLLEPLAGGFEHALNDPARPAAERAQLALALLLMKRAESVWPHLSYQPNPDLRSAIIHGCSAAGVDWHILQQGLARGEPGVLAAILSALGEYEAGQLPKSARALLRPQVAALFTDHGHPGVHSVAEWLLRSWDPDSVLPSPVAKPSQVPRAVPGWYLTNTFSWRPVAMWSLPGKRRVAEPLLAPFSTPCVVIGARSATTTSTAA